MFDFEFEPVLDASDYVLLFIGFGSTSNPPCFVLLLLGLLSCLVCDDKQKNTEWFRLIVCVSEMHSTNTERSRSRDTWVFSMQTRGGGKSSI